MKRIYAMVAVLSILAFGAAAQVFTSDQEIKIVTADEAHQQAIGDLKQMLSKVKVLSMKSFAESPPVKGAPYSADEITEATQMLANGTTIRRQDKTTVYRDGEGRVRRESPDQISIYDPVAGVSYLLDPKTQTARKLNVSIVTMLTPDGTKSVNVTMNGAGAAGAGWVSERQAVTTFKARVGDAAGAASGPGFVRFNGAELTTTGKGESLGKQMIEGVQSEGTRTTSTIETGAIGNDRPIQIVAERWYSPELQTVMMTKHSDPRTGDETFRLTNVRRGDPGAFLFQVPPGYQVVEAK